MSRNSPKKKRKKNVNRDFNEGKTKIYEKNKGVIRVLVLIAILTLVLMLFNSVIRRI